MALRLAIVGRINELCKCADGGSGPSLELMRHLLEDEPFDSSDSKDCSEVGNAASEEEEKGVAAPETAAAGGSSMADPESLFVHLRGLPCRPYYRELARRLLILSEHGGESPPAVIDCGDASDSFVPANEMGMIELHPLPSVPLFPLRLRLSNNSPPATESLVSACGSWIRSATDGDNDNGGEVGGGSENCHPPLLRLLGLRLTVGTVPGLLPPPRSLLLSSSRVPCKPNAKPPRLSVAARARAKHAHRGSDGYFGSVNGGAEVQNGAAEKTVQRLLDEAVWINIHAFGGMDDVPVLEVRTKEGYGVRWAMPKSVVRGVEEGGGAGEGVAFRGFLEPQMEDGHERQWRH